MGRYPRAALMAACTSRAAALMSRFKSNCNVTLVLPKLLEEVISVTEAIRPNWRSSGVATDDAIISGLAPGNPADTEIVGKSTCGSGDTGSKRKATAPAMEMAMTRRVVAIGLRMKGSLIFILVQHQIDVIADCRFRIRPTVIEATDPQSANNKQKSSIRCRRMAGLSVASLGE